MLNKSILEECRALTGSYDFNVQFISEEGSIHMQCTSKPSIQSVCVCLWQAKVVLEKAKQQLETQNVELDTELKQVSAARQESDRKRKQAEQQFQEASLKLAELEKTRGDLGEKASKYQVRCFSLCVLFI